MKNPFKILIILVVMLVFTLVAFAPASGATGDPALLNELLVSHTGTDNTEFIEIYGIPGTSLDGLSIIGVEGDSGSDIGSIDFRQDFNSADIIGPNGFYLVGNPVGLVANYGVTPNLAIGNDSLENSSSTYALVETSSISGDHVTSSEVVLDTVALTDGGAGDTFFFNAPVIGPDGSFFPAGAGRLSDGVDTDTVADWNLADFSLGPGNTPTAGDVPPPPPIPATIMEIQGNGRRSPLEGERIETVGVVILYNSSGSSFWMQDPSGDSDPSTSDGIFVSGGGFPQTGPRPDVGDEIRIIATVNEQQFGTSLPLTRLVSVEEIEIFSTDNLLPAPVPLVDLPDLSIPEGEVFWESLEGMRVSVANAPVSSATNGFGEFGMLAKDDAKPGSGFFADTQHILVQNLGDGVVDYNPERIMVDDSSLNEAIYVVPGDRVRSLVGVVDYTFSMYKLQPEPGSYDINTHNLPNSPVSKRSGGFGNLTITTYNVENLFDLELNTPVVADSFGRLGDDPGSGWGPPPTNNNTLIRNTDICQGDTIPDDAFDPSLEWTGLGNNNFVDLGSHTSTCDPAISLIISEYIEGSSFNKALEIYNGTGSAVNLGASNVTVQIFFNGSTSAGQTISLSGTLADGDVYVLAHPSADPAILAVADQTSGGVLFNGNDAITLNFGGKDDASSTPDPGELETQLSKLALSIEIELDLPEILVLQEVENTDIAQEVGDRVNDATDTNYVATSFETSDARGIEVAFLWDANRVTLLDAFQMTGPDVDMWFGPSSPSPGREPLVGVFEVNGQQVTIIGNHFKSKGGDDPLYYDYDPATGWQPDRVTEFQRKGQAQTVRNFVNSILDADPNALVMVAGDLNDFQFSEPGEGADNPVAILEGGPGEVPLTNLLNFEKPAETWTFVFDGNAQVLDHMLVSPALLDHFQAADVLHFNTNTPTLLLEDDPTSPLSASDHDPLESRFQFK